MISHVQSDILLKSVCHCILNLSLRLPDTDYWLSEKSDGDKSSINSSTDNFEKLCTCVIF